MASRSGICGMCGGGPFGTEHTPSCPSPRRGRLETDGSGNSIRELETDGSGNSIREFDTGANRSPIEHKIQYSRHLHPAVIHEFGEYMHRHRTRVDGTTRDADNWQLGIPKDAYIDSLVRHVIDLWRLHYGESPIDPDTGKPAEVLDLCSAIMFNIMGYMYELLVSAGMKRGREK